MHIPDGFLSIPVLAGCGLLSVSGIAYAIKKSKQIPESLIPLMGVSGAFVFAAQMINVPVGVGTSGHLLGGALLTALLGPHLAVIVMTCVVIVQSLLFQDGGVVALGANILVMAVMAPYISYFIMLLGKKVSSKLNTVALFLGAWVSVVLGALIVALLLGFSNTAPLVPVLVGMGLIHAITGIVEGLITVVVIKFFRRLRPDLIGSAV